MYYLLIKKEVQNKVLLEAKQAYILKIKSERHNEATLLTISDAQQLHCIALERLSALFKIQN